MGKRKEREYEVFRRGVRVHLGAELPERLGDERYLVFDASGRPHLIREANRPTEMIQQVFARSGNGVTDRFRPVLRAVGLEPHHQRHLMVDNAVHVLLWISAAVCIALTVTAVALLMLILAYASLQPLLLAPGG